MDCWPRQPRKAGSRTQTRMRAFGAKTLILALRLPMEVAPGCWSPSAKVASDVRLVYQLHRLPNMATGLETVPR